MGYSEASFSQYREGHGSQHSANKSKKSSQEKENSKKEESLKDKSSKNSLKRDKTDLEIVKELLKENQMLK